MGFYNWDLVFAAAQDFAPFIARVKHARPPLPTALMREGFCLINERVAIYLL